MRKYTVHFPLEHGEDDVFKSVTTLSEVVAFNIKNTLFACPGERPMEPTFGFCLKRYLFETPTQGMFETMHSGIIEQLKTWMPYLSVNNVNIKYDENDPHLLSITIRYGIPNQLPTTQLFLLMNTITEDVSVNF